MSWRSHASRSVFLTVIVSALCIVAAAILGAAPALAGGGQTISSAPTLPLGSLNVGGGKPDEFYRVPVSAGDQLQISYDMLGQEDCGYVSLYDPAVTDFTVEQATAVAGSSLKPGTQNVSITSPFNGTGTLAVGIGGEGRAPDYAYGTYAGGSYGFCRVVTPYSMTVTVEHLTQIAFAAVPSVVHSRKTFRIGARVQSPAGLPAGTCIFERIAGRYPIRIATAPVHNGACSALVHSARSGRASFRVTFQGSGWQTAQATSHSILSR